MPDDYSRQALAEARRSLNKRVQKLAETLEAHRKVQATVASTRPAIQKRDEEKYPALRERRR
jgi:hypothetical protein